MEKINPKVIALSLGIISAAVYLICTIFAAILPLETFTTLGNYFVHGIDLSSIAAKDTSFVDPLIGLILTFLSAAAIGYLFAVTYNALMKSSDQNKIQNLKVRK